jgi:tetratricopeptide (TPR) repeat protein
VWEVETGRAVGEPLRHEANVTSVAFSPDGKRVVTGSWDDTARVWEVETGRAVGEPLRHEDWVNSVAFSPDGNRVVTGSSDYTARVWEVETGRAVGEPLRHESTVTSGEVETGGPVGEPLRHEAGVDSVAFSPDGKRVVTGSGYGARVWDVWDPIPSARFEVQVQVRTARKIDVNGTAQPLSNEEWRAARQELLTHEAGWLNELREQSARETLTWHTQQAAQAERGQQWFAAAFHLNRLIQQRPGDADLLYRRATVLAEQDDWPGAVADFQARVRAHPDDVRMRFHLALAQLAGANRAAFAATYRALWDRLAAPRENIATPVETEADYLQSIESVAWLGVFGPEAVPDRKRWLEIAEEIAKASEPRRPGLLARLFGAEDKFDPATHASNLETLGGVLYRLGRPGDAVTKLDEALKLDPAGDFIEAHLLLALAHHDLGHTSDAARHLQTAVEKINTRLQTTVPKSAPGTTPTRSVSEGAPTPTVARRVSEASTSPARPANPPAGTAPAPDSKGAGEPPAPQRKQAAEPPAPPTPAPQTSAAQTKPAAKPGEPPAAMPPDDMPAESRPPPRPDWRERLYWRILRAEAESEIKPVAP